jgi:RNA polymerase sigma-70 factor (ECF subfamily)
MMHVEAMTTTASAPPIDHEAALVSKARSGDHEAFGELVTLHQRRIWRVCRQYVDADEADNACQEAFVKAFTRLDSFDGRAAFTTWLTRIAINTCLDSLRRARRAPVVVGTEDEDQSPALDRAADDGADPEATSMHRQTVLRLREVETSLPPGQRRIFRLRFHAEMELEEIADVLDVHVGTVKTQLHRAVHRVRQELGAFR